MSHSFKLILIILILLPFHAQGVIEDNSFLLEEAYNQEKNEYQFIQRFDVSERGGQDYSVEFEAPITPLTHQFSFDLSHTKDDDSSQRAFGDLALNYRYQSYNHKNNILTQRLGVIIPTGSVEKETSNGVYGFTFVQSATLKLNEVFMNHWNIGITTYPDENLTGFLLGGSFVYLYQDNFNFLFEALYETDESVTPEGGNDRANTLFLNPGARFAYETSWNETQIVPGISFPFQYTEKRFHPAILLYLSLESTLD